MFRQLNYIEFESVAAEANYRLLIGRTDTLNNRNTSFFFNLKKIEDNIHFLVVGVNDIFDSENYIKTFKSLMDSRK